MILDKLKLIIEEEEGGEIRIRGYLDNFQIKLAREYNFKLKVHHIAKPVRYILQDLFSDRYQLSETDVRNINMGRAVDYLVKEIWYVVKDLYDNNKISIDLNSEILKISSLYNVESEELLKLGKLLFSILSIFPALGFKLEKYSDYISGTPSKVPLQFSGISPDILLKYKDTYIVGDVKYGRYREEYKYLITAYALIFEELKREDVNYGILVHISPELIPKIKIFKLSDSLRSETIERIRDLYEEIYQASLKE